MAYVLFFYNYLLTMVTVAALLGFGVLYLRRRRRLDLYTAVLLLLYLIDITLLWMVEAIPGFAKDFGTLQAQRPYIYSLLNTSILFCYRLILGDLLDHPVSNHEGIVWVAAISGAAAEWFVKSDLYHAVVDPVVPAALRIWTIGSSLWIYHRQRDVVEAPRRHAVLFFIAVYCVAIASSLVFPNEGSRILPHEILGLTYTASAIGYLVLRLKQTRSKAESLKLLAFSNRYSLTRREEELLRLLIEHKTNREIGEELRISLGTVKTHVRHIYEKIGVSSREELNERVHAEARNTAA